MNDSRIETPTGRQTIRDQVVLYLVDLLSNFVFDDLDPTGPLLFDNVNRGTLDDISPAMCPGAMIEEGTAEPRTNFYGKQDETLRLFINYKVIKAQGVDVYSLLNYYLGRIIQVLIRPEDDNLQLAGLTLGVTLVGNTLQYNGGSDPEPGGTVMFDVDIRTTLGDPFKE